MHTPMPHEGHVSLRQSVRQSLPPEAVLIGLTGGIASGKSLAASVLSNQGLAVISSDAIAKEVMATNAEVKKSLVDLLGPDVYLSDQGDLNRQFLSSKIFGNTPEAAELRSRVNLIVHPWVIEGIVARAASLFRKGSRCVVNESALLFESGFDAIYDYIVCITSDDSVKVNRMVKERLMTEQEAKDRISSQMPDRDKADLSDFVIANNSSKEAFVKAVQGIGMILPFLSPQDESSED